MNSTAQKATMSTSETKRDASVARVDMKFEAVVLPVSDVDRAKAFYENLGWRLDVDFRSAEVAWYPQAEEAGVAEGAEQGLWQAPFALGRVAVLLDDGREVAQPR